jgi:DNA repair protein SbcC/Rad50
MIPIQLTLQGIYSYQEKQTIDFTKLTEANIFGIFGYVGSGKSTILEAITYALYGNTDRLNQKGDNRNYNMMNLKSNELFIEFIFRTGRDDSEYMATVKGRRNSKQFEDVKALDRAAYKKTNGEWLPIEVDSLAIVIGLSYENFKRTVIIPQGRFQEFLQLGNSDRTKMMKELFNLEKFELYYKVVSLESKNDQQLQSLKGQMLQLGEINPEQIRVVEELLVQLNAEILKKTGELARNQGQEEKFRKLKELSAKIVEAGQTLSRLRMEEPEYALLENKIREYEYCLLHFKNLFDSAKNSSGRILQYEQTIRTDQALLVGAMQQLADLESGFVALKTAFDGRETFRQQAEELEKIAKINELNLLRLQIKERLSNGEKVLSDTVEKIKLLQESKETLRSSVREIKDRIPDMALLSKVKDWFTIHQSLLSGQKEIESERNAVRLDIEDIERQKALFWKEVCEIAGSDEHPSEVFDSEEADTYSKGKEPDFREMEIFLETTKALSKKTLDDFQRQIEHLSVQTRLEEYAANLEEGQPCPLCGALSHPQPLNAQSVSEALQKVRERKDDAENRLMVLEQLQQQLSGMITTHKLKKGHQQKILQKQKEHEAKRGAHQLLFSWVAYPDEGTVSAAFDLADRLQKQLKANETELETTSANLEKETRNKEKFNHALDDFRQQFTAGTVETKTLTGQLSLLKLSDFEHKTPEQIKTDMESCLIHYQEINKSYVTANDTINALRKERDVLSGRLEVNKHLLEQENAQKKTIDASIREQLDLSGYAVLTEVDAVLARSMDTELEKRKVSTFRQALAVSDKQLAALRKEQGDKNYDEEQHLLVLESIRQLSQELTLCNQHQGKLGSDLENLKVNYEAFKALSSQASALQSRAEDLKTLRQLFKASGFVNYISSVYLQELCRAGNDRFYKLTRQKLSLEVTDDNNFQVRDFMNGGKVRNVKTLSGGQTFQAALSLALALADNIQKITESNQNFFFLDEGFGSLDKESLEVVFDTLKSLRKENRIVGVISHVEEMQQEIDTHLKIVNDEEKGSRIKASWE